MEGINKGKIAGAEDAGHRGESMVERKRQEAFLTISDELAKRLEIELGQSFEVNNREYELTCAEDCMVAFANSLRAEVRALHDEVVAKDDYYEEKATAKLLELFKAYERLVSLYAELRSYYPGAAERVETHLPPLKECFKHGEELWQEVSDKKQ